MILASGYHHIYPSAITVTNTITIIITGTGTIIDTITDIILQYQVMILVKDLVMVQVLLITIIGNVLIIWKFQFPINFANWPFPLIYAALTLVITFHI